MIDVMAIQPLLGRSTTTMLKSNFISIANARQNRVYNTISPRIYKFAIKHNKPVIPLAISFRPRKGIFKIFSKNPFADVHIGEPMLPDTSLIKKEATDKLHKEAYHIIQTMAGIKETDPNYNTNQNIDEYVKTL